QTLYLHRERCYAPQFPGAVRGRHDARSTGEGPKGAGGHPAAGVITRHRRHLATAQSGTWPILSAPRSSPFETLPFMPAAPFLVVLIKRPGTDETMSRSRWMHEQGRPIVRPRCTSR